VWSAVVFAALSYRQAMHHRNVRSRWSSARWTSCTIAGEVITTSGPPVMIAVTPAGRQVWTSVTTRSQSGRWSFASATACFSRARPPSRNSRPFRTMRSSVSSSLSVASACAIVCSHSSSGIDATVCRRELARGHHLLDQARMFCSEITSPAPDKTHHEWGQSLDGFRTLVQAFAEPGELVCDPFLGGGTTALAAVAQGRRFVGCDVDPEAIETTRRRLSGLDEEPDRRADAVQP
jgi:hypothetical protein